MFASAVTESQYDYLLLKFYTCKSIITNDLQYKFLSLFWLILLIKNYCRKIFWSDWNRDSPKLEVSQFDGSNRAVFVQGPAVQLPNSLAIDWDSDELCWADAGTKSIGK